MKKKNLGTNERILRAGIGTILAFCAVFFLFTTGRLLWQVVFVALFALGVDFVVTGIRGYCPLYNLLGWSTAAPEAHA